MVETILQTDATLDLLTLHGLHEHITSLADSRRSQLPHSGLHPPLGGTAFLIFELIGSPEPGLPESIEEPDRQALLEGLVAQCGELASAPHVLEAPVYAAYAMFDAQNAVRLHRLADETAAVWRDLEPGVRSRTIVHLQTQCGKGVYMTVLKELIDPTQ